jgi:heterodisulfide reductase subunit A
MNNAIKKKVAVIGAGIAGMEAAGKLSTMGFDVCLLEKGNIVGGHVANWHRVFPDRRPAKEIISQLKSAIHDSVSIIYGAEVHKVVDVEKGFRLSLTDGQTIDANAVLVTTGFDLFNASKKEEYGYKIYQNIITSADLEAIFTSGKTLRNGKGVIPQRIAFIHCVGSRDEKAGNKYCSKVCCVSAVKQAIEVKQAQPNAEVYCFYMDLRMFDRYFEDLYFEAQSKYGIRFIRGRLSEACENQDGGIVLKAEDTLAGKPIKMTVDMAILMSGMVASKGTLDMIRVFNLETVSDKFVKTADNHGKLNLTNRDGIFISGACSGPKSIAETLADSRSAVLMINEYLKN